jgi:hypothetical protein
MKRMLRGAAVVVGGRLVGDDRRAALVGGHRMGDERRAAQRCPGAA